MEKIRKSGYTLTLKTEANGKHQGGGEPLYQSASVTEGNLEIKSVPIKKYSPYYSERVLFDIEDGTPQSFQPAYRFVPRRE